MPDDRIPAPEFVRMASAVVEALGTKKYPNERGLTFEDDLIAIRTHYNGLDLEVTRKAQKNTESHLRVSNPTTMVSKGKIIRHHGEAWYLDEHLTALFGRVTQEG